MPGHRAHCTICEHANRKAIEQQLVDGIAYKHICNAFGPSPSALSRHRAQHMAKAMARVLRRDYRRAGKLLDRVEDLYQATIDTIHDGQEEGHHGVTLAAVREARKTAELLGKLNGELRYDGAQGTQPAHPGGDTHYHVHFAQSAADALALADGLQRNLQALAPRMGIAERILSGDKALASPGDVQGREAFEREASGVDEYPANKR